MAKTNVLFVCPDNSLLGLLAEAWLNARARGLMRAFSAGIIPADHMNPNVPRLLSAYGVDPSGLAPKPVGVFLVPYALVPDRIIYLTKMPAVAQPTAWKGITSSHWWNVAPAPPFGGDLAAGATYLQRIQSAVTGLIGSNANAFDMAGDKARASVS